ncbi:hypothetical protein RRG08_019273 [Elysia crispata]|uniref:Uncharacterized protein n=1 Tax=Elysia crispata TaxID=231223 RepID=A0AAE0Y9N7_9GAST|nr:hypothetical protein RRG08_019273 [Elysia crispata]
MGISDKSFIRPVWLKYDHSVYGHPVCLMMLTQLRHVGTLIDMERPQRSRFYNNTMGELWESPNRDSSITLLTLQASSDEAPSYYLRGCALFRVWIDEETTFC